MGNRINDVPPHKRNVNTVFQRYALFPHLNVFENVAFPLREKKLPKKETRFQELPKFPAVRRDLAVLVDTTVTFAEIERLAFAADKKIVKRVELFDVYEGKKLPEGKKSYAFAIYMQDETKTMNDKQTDGIMKKIIASVEKQLGAELR